MFCKVVIFNEYLSDGTLVANNNYFDNEQEYKKFIEQLKKNHINYFEK